MDVAQLKQFIVSNNIVGTSAGVCIALATKDSIQSLISDIIVPSFVALLRTLNIPSLAKYLPVGKQLNVGNFIKQLITFILIIIISFAFVKVAFGYLLGVGTATPTNARATNARATIHTKPNNQEPFSYSGQVSNTATAPSR